MRKKSSNSFTASAVECRWRSFFLFFSFAVLILTGGAAVPLGNLELSTKSLSIPKYPEAVTDPVCVPFEHTLNDLPIIHTDTGVGTVLFATPQHKKIGSSMSIGLHGSYVMTDIHGKVKVCSTPEIYHEAQLDKSNKIVSIHPNVVLELPNHGSSVSADSATESPKLNLAYEEFHSTVKIPDTLELDLLIDARLTEIEYENMSIMKRVSQSPHQYCASVNKLYKDQLHYPMVGIKMVTDRHLRNESENKYSADLLPAANVSKSVASSQGLGSVNKSSHGDSSISDSEKAPATSSGASSVYEQHELVQKYHEFEQHELVQKYHEFEGDVAASNAHDNAENIESLSSHFDDGVNLGEDNVSNATSLEKNDDSTNIDPSEYDSPLAKFMANTNVNNIKSFFLYQAAKKNKVFGSPVEGLDFFNIQYILSFASIIVERYSLSRDNDYLKVLSDVFKSSRRLTYYLRDVDCPSYLITHVPLRLNESREERLLKAEKYSKILHEYINAPEVRCQLGFEPIDTNNDNYIAVYWNRRNSFAADARAAKLATEFMFENNSLKNLFEYTWKFWLENVTDANIEEGARFIRENMGKKMEVALLSHFAPSRLTVFLNAHKDKLPDEVALVSSDQLQKIYSLTYKNMSEVSKSTFLLEFPDVTIKYFIKELLSDRDLVVLYTCLAGGTQCEESLLLKELSSVTIVDAFLVNKLLNYKYAPMRDESVIAMLTSLLLQKFNVADHNDITNQYAIVSKLIYLVHILQSPEERDAYFYGLRNNVNQDQTEADGGISDKADITTGIRNKIEDSLPSSEDDSEMTRLMTLFGPSSINTADVLFSIHEDLLILSLADDLTKSINYFVDVLLKLMLLMTNIKEVPKESFLEENELEAFIEELYDKNSPGDLYYYQKYEMSKISALRLEYKLAFEKYLVPLRFGDISKPQPAPERDSYSRLHNVAVSLAEYFAKEGVLKPYFDQYNHYNTPDALVALKVLAQPKYSFSHSLELEKIYDFFHSFSNTCFDFLYSENASELNSSRVIIPTAHTLIEQEQSNEDVVEAYIETLKSVYFATPNLVSLLNHVASLEMFRFSYSVPFLAEEDSFMFHYISNVSTEKQLVSILSREHLDIALTRFLSWYAHTPLYDINPINMYNLSATLEKFYGENGFIDAPKISSSSVTDVVNSIEMARNTSYPRILSDPVMNVYSNSHTICTSISNIHEDDYTPYVSVASFHRGNSFIVANNNTAYLYISDEMNRWKVPEINVSDVAVNVCKRITFPSKFIDVPKVFTWITCRYCSAHQDLFIHVEELSNKAMTLCLTSRNGKSTIIKHGDWKLQYIAMGTMTSARFRLNTSGILETRMRHDLKTVLARNTVGMSTWDSHVPILAPTDHYVRLVFEDLHFTKKGEDTLENIIYIDRMLKHTVNSLHGGNNLEVALVGRFYTWKIYTAVLRFRKKYIDAMRQDMFVDLDSLVRNAFIDQVVKHVVLPNDDLIKSLDLMRNGNASTGYSLQFSKDLFDSIGYQSSVFIEQYRFCIENSEIQEKFSMAPTIVEMMESQPFLSYTSD